MCGSALCSVCLGKTLSMFPSSDGLYAPACVLLWCCEQKVVMFDACKREAFHPNSGFKKLFRRLRGSYKVAL